MPCQENMPAAQRIQDMAKQLSADAAKTMSLLTGSRRIPDGEIWPLLRPVLRLLLWILPQHVPSVGFPTTAHLQPAGPTTATQGGADFKQDKHRRKAGSPFAADCRQQLAQSYVKEVATVGIRFEEPSVRGMLV
jgi:hypothetical protein